MQQDNISQIIQTLKVRLNPMQKYFEILQKSSNDTYRINAIANTLPEFETIKLGVEKNKDVLEFKSLSAILSTLTENYNQNLQLDSKQVSEIVKEIPYINNLKLNIEKLKSTTAFKKELQGKSDTLLNYCNEKLTFLEIKRKTNDVESLYKDIVFSNRWTLFKYFIYFVIAIRIITWIF